MSPKIDSGSASHSQWIITMVAQPQAIHLLVIGSVQLSICRLSCAFKTWMT